MQFCAAEPRKLMSFLIVITLVPRLFIYLLITKILICVLDYTLIRLESLFDLCKLI